MSGRFITRHRRAKTAYRGSLELRYRTGCSKWEKQHYYWREWSAKIAYRRARGRKLSVAACRYDSSRYDEWGNFAEVADNITRGGKCQITSILELRRCNKQLTKKATGGRKNKSPSVSTMHISYWWTNMQKQRVIWSICFWISRVGPGWSRQHKKWTYTSPGEYDNWLAKSQ